MLDETCIIGTEKEKNYKINGILWKLKWRDYAACLNMQ
jgi:hypothetical protein